MLKEIALNTFWLLIIVLCCSLIASIIITPITNLRKTKQKAEAFDNIINDMEEQAKKMLEKETTDEKK